MMNFGGKRPIFGNFRHFLDNQPMFMEDLPKKGPLFREFRPKNPPIWAAHSRTLNMLVPPGTIDLKIGSRAASFQTWKHFYDRLRHTRYPERIFFRTSPRKLSERKTVLSVVFRLCFKCFENDEHTNNYFSIIFLPTSIQKVTKNFLKMLCNIILSW